MAKSSDMTAPPLNQVAFSVVDLRCTERWFREGFGFLPAGGSRWMMRGPLAARVQGLPQAASTCWWLVGRNPWFQLEFFQFERPLARPLPRNHRPCDIGYTRIGLSVADFEGTLARLAQLGTEPLAAPIGQEGLRHACVLSPDGVHVEIMEDDPLGLGAAVTECPVAVRSVTLSVPNLRRSTMSFRSLGLEDWTGTLHTAEHEASWGLGNARLLTHAFKAGDVIVELAQYLDPPGKPWPPGYRISDQGILNIAFGARSKAEHRRLYTQAISAGAQANCTPLHLPGIGGVVYVNDRDGFSVELLWLKPGRPDRQWGFAPLPLEQRPTPASPALLQESNHS